VEVLVLQSLGLHAQGNARGALDAVVEALALAEPEGFLRVFLDEGAGMRALLRQATARGLAGEYARRVLQAFEAPMAAAHAPSMARMAETPTNSRAVTGAPAPAGAAAALTARELEILRLIAGGLRNQAIADELSISAATVKRHIANAYGKLGAGHRTEALKRARELRLL
jgi:LuxR family maltose regulon positive regulatory protein